MQESIRTTDLSDEELGRRGRTIYDRELRDKLEPAHTGESVVVHVVNGDYYVDRDEIKALDAALARYPGQVFYITRVGHDVADSFLTPQRRQSLAAVTCDLLHEGLRPLKPQAGRAQRFSIVGVGDSGAAGRRRRVSEWHDDFMGRTRW